jgi:hypothetical protein
MVTTAGGQGPWHHLGRLVALGGRLDPHRPHRGPVVPANTVAFSVAFGAVLGAFATVGAVVVARQPRNAVGWVCLGVGLIGSWNGFAANYAEVALVVRPGSLPGGWRWAGRPGGLETCGD